MDVSLENVTRQCYIQEIHVSHLSWPQSHTSTMFHSVCIEKRYSVKEF